MKNILTSVALVLAAVVSAVSPAHSSICAAPLVLRSEKGSQLTSAEGDQNITQVRLLCNEADAWLTTGTADGRYSLLGHTHTAAQISILDAGGFYTGTSVETALQEAGPTVKYWLDPSLAAGTAPAYANAIAYSQSSASLVVSDGAGTWISVLPAAHAYRHAAGGGDDIAVDSLVMNNCNEGQGLLRDSFGTFDTCFDPFTQAAADALYSPLGHTHVAADITDFTTAMEAVGDPRYSALSHTHAHSALTGLTTGDDHTQYAKLGGRSGGQTMYGGTATGDTFTLFADSADTTDPFIKLWGSTSGFSGGGGVSLVVGNNDVSIGNTGVAFEGVTPSSPGPYGFSSVRADANGRFLAEWAGPADYGDSTLTGDPATQSLTFHGGLGHNNDGVPLVLDGTILQEKPPNVTYKPTCDVTARWKHWTTAGAAGVADKAELCMKLSDDSYAWVVAGLPASALPAATTSAQGAVTLATPSSDVTAGHVVQASDDRLHDARTPTSTLAHASTHAAAGSDPITITPTQAGLSNVTNDPQTKAAVMPNTAPSAGQLPVGNAGNTAYVPRAISGDFTLASDGTATLATVLVASSCGDGTHTCAITYDAKGRITAVTNTAISFPPAVFGSDTQVTFNDAGTMSGNAAFTFAKATGTASATVMQAATLQGGTGSGGNLLVRSTTNATPGMIQLGGTSSSWPALYAPGANAILKLVQANDSTAFAILDAQRFRSFSGTLPLAIEDGFGFSMAPAAFVAWSGSASDASQAKDTIISRAAAGTVSVDTSTAGNGLGTLQSLGITTKAGSALGLTATAPAATSASQTGIDVTITPSNAVDGSSTHAATNGGDVVAAVTTGVNAGRGGMLRVPGAAGSSNGICIGSKVANSGVGLYYASNSGTAQLTVSDCGGSGHGIVAGLDAIIAGTNNTFMCNGQSKFCYAQNGFYYHWSDGQAQDGTRSLSLGMTRTGALTQNSEAGFTATADAQTTTTVLRNSTTDGTQTELFINGSTTRMVLPNTSAWTVDCFLVARRTDATGGSAAYEIEGLFIRDANAASTALVGSLTQTVIAETNAAWDATLTADTTNGSVDVKVTGEAAKTIRWVATCRNTEVTN